MAFGHSFKELRNKTKDDLIEYYDSTKTTGETNHIILHEIKRREDAEHQKAIEDMTKQMRNMTAIILIATIANIIIFLWN